MQMLPEYKSWVKQCRITTALQNPYHGLMVRKSLAGLDNHETTLGIPIMIAFDRKQKL